MNMKYLTGIAFVLFSSVALFARQENTQKELVYQTEMYGSASSGNYTPFWMVSNRYGMTPLAAGNAWAGAGLQYAQTFAKGFRWTAGADLAMVIPRHRNVFVRQLYAELGYRSFLLTVGSREQANFLWDKDLSSGDMVLSANARPIPGVKISIPSYTFVPGTRKRLSVKGSFGAGRSFDSPFLASFINSSQVYIKDILWHHKALYFRLAEPAGRFPVSLELGLQHAAQWGGTSTDMAAGRQPQSVKDFMRIVLGMSGGDDASEMDRANVLGNHYGSYDIRLSYQSRHWVLRAYHQRYFEDKSGTIFGNGKDGLWGLQLDLPQVAWLQKILVECLDTRHQSGPLHFIAFDHEKYPGIGGGADRYYNNEEYTTGLSYFSRSVGSPLLPSPEYNTDGLPGFKNTRVYAWHFGVSGAISPRISYRLLFSSLNSWGTPYRPFLNSKTGTFGLLEITCSLPGLPGWTITGSFASDTGTVTEKSAGFGVCVTKRGILPIEPKR
jgi:hypothetical protein